MSDARQKAIRLVLDEGADLTEENIQASMEPEPEAKPDNSLLIAEMQGMRSEMRQLIDTVKSQQMVVNVPEAKVPIVNVQEREIPERPRRKLSFSFVRDMDGRIIKATGEEE